MMADSASYAVALTKSRMFLLEALERQGFDVAPFIGFSVTALHRMYRSGDLDMLLENPLTGGKVMVRYHDSKAIRASNIADYVDDYFAYESSLSKNDGLIIVGKDGPNDSIKKALRGAWAQSGAYVLVIPLASLQFSILDHALVPKHTVLTAAAAEGLRKEYGLSSDKQLPSISRFDPVAQAIGLRPGQICQIERPSRTAVTCKFYRICSA